jgi:hypothetical protein
MRRVMKLLCSERNASICVGQRKDEISNTLKIYISFKNGVFWDITILEDAILHSPRRAKVKSYVEFLSIFSGIWHWPHYQSLKCGLCLHT